MDPVYAERSATGKYRTTPLRALWQHAPYFHDGSAPDLVADIARMRTVLGIEPAVSLREGLAGVVSRLADRAP